MVCTVSNNCQMILVPVAPIAWQPNESTPREVDSGDCFTQMQTMEQMQPMQNMQVVWAQPVPFADSSCCVPQGVPQEYGTCIGVITLPTEMPMGAEDYTPQAQDTFSEYSFVPDTYNNKPMISSSTARRQRRQRAAERAAGRAKASELARARAASAAGSWASEASTSDGDEAPIFGAESAKLEELMAQLNAGGDERSAAISALRGCVWRLARDPLGCRIVQLALEVASSSDAKALVAELHGRVEAAIYSPHANYVIQKVIEVMPAPVSSFVAEEVSGMAGAVARHRFGCRILCRLLEHTVCGAGGGAPAALIDESLADAEELVRHTFGHYVAKTILEHGTSEQKRRIAHALRQGPPGTAGLMRNALHRNASYVMEKALHCSTEEACFLAHELLAGGGVAALGHSPFGIHVVKAMLRMPDIEQIAHAQLLANAEHLRSTKYGSKLLEEMGLGFNTQ